jgi:preprotein translocase subunit SecE
MPRMGTSSKTARAAPRSERGFRRFVPRFFLDIISELSKVVWPTREDTLYMAVVVLIVTIIFGAILGGIDFFFAYVVDKAILDPNAWFR